MITSGDGWSTCCELGVRWACRLKIAENDTEPCTLAPNVHGYVSLTVIMGSLSPLAAFLGHPTTFRPQAPGMNAASGYAATATGDQHPERPSP
jgi:hypothetical protein